MKYHDQLLKDIDSTYTSHSTRDNPRPLNHYKLFCAKHKVLIDSIKDELHTVSEQLPSIGSRVLAVEDLSSLGKGTFLSDLWYNEHGFVSDLCYDDAYGYVTHWTYLRLEND